MRKATYCILLFAVLLIVSGCRSIQYVPVEKVTYKTDTLYRSNIKTDSVYIESKDTFMMKGDTILTTRWRTKVVMHNVTDTIHELRTDSIQVPVPYEVEKKLTLWQEFKVKTGGYSFAALILLLMAAVLYIIKKVFKL